jgi:hypothetical protein
MHNHNQGRDTKMGWLLLLGCLVPLALLAAVYLLNLSLSPLLVGAVVVFYPLIHLLVMRYISHDASLPPDRNRNESR